ncbi:hypothetical protein GALMADRAFT_138662 [Galerina marginata CBS 339.88]|uniref:Electron transfer flavoprotein alpha/beta-subunit N-terminal domain-containing protein n=1 Tax=Galerina marginata (strain CBS 339.88) TaxID=685588 RepID=A0A067T322_GALM3|nr:hypothetical protein GALMADRAFT_138662 [Galerina marginata CBS 339.88]
MSSSIIDDLESSFLISTLTGIIHGTLDVNICDKIDLVILGKQAIEDDLGVTFASKLELDTEIDGGGEELRCRLPLVLITDLRLNEPRYASLPPEHNESKKEAHREARPRSSRHKVAEPQKRVGGGQVANVDELIAKLKEAGIEAA